MLLVRNSERIGILLVLNMKPLDTAVFTRHIFVSFVNLCYEMKTDTRVLSSYEYI